MTLGLFTLGWIVFGCGFTVYAAWLTHRVAVRSRRASAQSLTLPPIDIIRPCEGIDPGLEENLLSTATAHYPAPRRVFIAVSSRRDPAFAVAERVCARATELAPDVPVSVVVTDVDSMANRKAAQLAAVYPQTTAPVIVQADSDVRLDDRSLPALLAALVADPNAGASYAPAVEVAPVTFGDRFSAALLSSSPHALIVLGALGAATGGAPLVAGALLAHRREALDAIGGFPVLEPYLGEDFELGRRLHALGRSVQVSAEPARCTDCGLTLWQVAKRYARWLLVVRRQRPVLIVGNFLILTCLPILVGLTLATLALRDPYAPLAALALVGFMLLRGGLALTARRAYGVPGGYLRSLVWAIGGESLALVSSTMALGPSTVEWRGRRFYIGARGAMASLPARR